MTLANRARDLDAVRDGLTRWLQTHRPGADLTVAPLSRPAAGLSSETLFVEVEWAGSGAGHHQSLVARLPPARAGLFPDYDLSRQARAQELLAAAGIPVAAPLAFEHDEGWVGAPFLLMPRVPGRILANHPSYLTESWLHDADREDQARVHEGFFGVLADIHRLDWEPLGFGYLARGGGGLLAELDWWSDYLDWAADGSPPPATAEGMAWCRANRPEPEPRASLLWGDVQIVNAVFDDAMRVAAVLDWEMASIGPAEMDLGWFYALHDATVETVGADLPGFPDRETTIARYERSLGRDVADLQWFEAFGLLRSGAIMVRIARLLADVGIDDSWLTRGNPTLDRLERLIDLT